LLHEGQFEGRKARVPVFLKRRPQEAPDTGLQKFYRRLLQAVNVPDMKEGAWTLCERTGWPDNSSYLNLIGWSWSKGNDHHVIIVNLSDDRAQGRIRVPFEELGGRTWRMTDVITGATYDRDGNELHDAGLYVDLGAWDFHVLKF
jgi:hypothetical protein